jgi:hypothetical protein
MFGSGRGRVLLFHGTQGLPSTTPQVIEGPHNGARFGAVVANAGSLLNTAGDGLAVSGSNAAPGRVYVYGSTGSIVPNVPTVTFTGTGVGCTSTFGEHIASVGNIDGLHRDDLLISGSGCSVMKANEGVAYLFTSTATTATYTNWAQAGDTVGAALGPVAGLGDVNGDGRPEFALGVPRWSSGATTNGRVVVFFGAPSGLPTSSVVINLPTTGGAVPAFGAAIAGGFDLNRDGNKDIVIGAPGWQGVMADQGAIWAFRFNGLTPVVLTSYIGIGPERLGASIAMGNSLRSPHTPTWRWAHPTTRRRSSQR